MKKTISLILATACILAAIGAFSGCGLFGSKMTFALNDDGKSYSLTRCTPNADKEIVVPETYNDLPVTAIGDNAFEANQDITSISLPESIVSIGNKAFNNCRGLTSITLPKNITSIGYSAFADCRGLTSIVIPNGVKELLTETFYRCSNLKKVTLGSGIEKISYSAFEECNALDEIYYNGSLTEWFSVNLEYGLSNPFKMYIQNELVTELVVPNGITHINWQTFSNCSSLTSVTLSVGVIKLEGSFADCINLTEINFRGTVEQWNAIEKNDSWNYNVPAQKVICSNGEVDL